MDQIELIELNKINDEKGSVFHIIKNHDFNIKEVYLSSLEKNIVKGWKKHKEMTLNLVVIKGNVLFTIIGNNIKTQYMIGDNNYCRIQIPPNNWVSFEGMDDENLIINCADMIHDPDETILKKFNGYNQDFSNWV